MGRFKITIKSHEGKVVLSKRKLSRTIRLITFLSTARLARRFETTTPKRGCPTVFSLDSMVKNSLLDFVA